MLDTLLIILVCWIPYLLCYRHYETINNTRMLDTLLIILVCWIPYLLCYRHYETIF